MQDKTILIANQNYPQTSPIAFFAILLKSHSGESEITNAEFTLHNFSIYFYLPTALKPSEKC